MDIHQNLDDRTDAQIDEYVRGLTREADHIYLHIQSMCKEADRLGRLGQLWDEDIAEENRRYQRLLSKITGLGGPIR